MLSLVLSLPPAASSSAQSYAACAPVRLMPLGDSITVGKGSGGTNLNHNDYMTGYRQPLALKLSSAGYAVDFVGGEQTGRLATPSFDIDHEGHSGYTPSQIAYPNSTTGKGGITNWLAADPSDVVLLHIGTNGLKTEDDANRHVRRVSTILDKIDQNSKKIIVVLALIINQTPYSSLVSYYNNTLRTMAEQRIVNGDKIVIVDMEKALSYPGDLYDKLHPNESGYAKMAGIWQGALKKMLPRCVSNLYLPIVINNK